MMIKTILFLKSSKPVSLTLGEIDNELLDPNNKTRCLSHDINWYMSQFGGNGRRNKRKSKKVQY